MSKSHSESRLLDFSLLLRHSENTYRDVSSMPNFASRRRVRREQIHFRSLAKNSSNGDSICTTDGGRPTFSQMEEAVAVATAARLGSEART